MKHFIFTVWIFVLLFASAAADEFTVASANIRSFRRMNGKFDVSNTIAAIGKLQSDICALQEVRNPNLSPAPLEIMAKQLEMSHFFARTLKRKGFEYGIGTISRFKAEKIAQLKLPQPIPSEPRSVLILKISAPQGTFYFVNTHLSDGKAAAKMRLQQLTFILEHLEKNRLYPAILLGDLNAVPGQPPIELLASKWQIIGDNTPTFPASRPKFKLDHIAFYPKDAFEVIEYQVVNDPVSSDHRPVKAKLRFKKK